MHARNRLPRPLAGALAVSLALVPFAGATGAVAQDPAPITIEAFDLGYTPTAIEVPAPGAITLDLHNAGAIQHDLTFPDGTSTGLVDAGADGTVTFDVPAGGIDFWCSLPGHKEAGMKGRIRVSPPSSARP